jgi:hypothetical protein
LIGYSDVTKTNSQFEIRFQIDILFENQSYGGNAMSDNEPDVFMAMVREELNQYQKFFLFQERELFRQRKYEELARKSLRQTQIFAALVLLTIITFSLISIMHFIDFGNHNALSSFVLGLLSWAFVIVSTIFYTKNILEKKKCMERVLKLLEAREQFIESKQSI